MSALMVASCRACPWSALGAVTRLPDRDLFQERRQREERPSPCCLSGWTSVRRLHPPPLTGSQGRVSCGCGEWSRSQGDSALVQCLLGSDSSAPVPLRRCRAVRRSCWVSMNGCPWGKRTDSRLKGFGCSALVTCFFEKKHFPSGTASDAFPPSWGSLGAGRGCPRNNPISLGLRFLRG